MFQTPEETEALQDPWAAQDRRDDEPVARVPGSADAGTSASDKTMRGVAASTALRVVQRPAWANGAAPPSSNGRAANCLVAGDTGRVAGPTSSAAAFRARVDREKILMRSCGLSMKEALECVIQNDKAVQRTGAERRSRTGRTRHTPRVARNRILGGEVTSVRVRTAAGTATGGPGRRDIMAEAREATTGMFGTAQIRVPREIAGCPRTRMCPARCLRVFVVAGEAVVARSPPTEFRLRSLTQNLNPAVYRKSLFPPL